MSAFLADMKTRMTGFTHKGAAVTIAAARIPDSPDMVLTLREYAGDPPKDYDAGGLPAFESPGLQLIARVAPNAGVAAAEALAVDAMRWLAGRHVNVATQRYDWVAPNHRPFLMGFDENDRPLVVCNFRVQRWGDVSSAGRHT